MKVLKYCVFIFFLSVSNAYAVAQILDVAVIFDSDTTFYNKTEQSTLANNIVVKLKKSFSNSELTNYIDFRLKHFESMKVLKNSNGTYLYNDLTQAYHNNQSYNNGVKTTPENLHLVQKEQNVDVILAIVKPSDYIDVNNGKFCATALFVPTKSHIGSDFTTVTSLLKFGDLGIVFITDDSECLNKSYLVAHEVGHSFGLWHGPSAQLYTNETGHYDSVISLQSNVNGYGDLTAYDSYGTIMSGPYLGIDNYRINNRFSASSKYKCGVYQDQICGASYANAIQMISKYALSFNKRGDWYTY